MEIEARPLRVLHLAHVRWFNAEAQYALDLAVAMAARGHGVEFFAQSGSPAAEKARAAGLVTHEEGGFNAKGIRSAAALGAAARLLRILGRGSYDAVEAHRPEGFPLVAWACHRAGVPLIRVRGDMRPIRRDPLNRWLHSRRVAALVASNRTIEHSLRERLGPGIRVLTIPGGVDPEVYAPDGPRVDPCAEAGVRKGRLVVGILGRLSHLKGHGDFLEAARRSLGGGADASFVVLLKEPSPREAALREQVAADPLLRGRVGFLGRREDLPAVLRSFDLGVVASTGSEANCRVGLEWMASGVPLLATRVGVLPDLVAEGETGYLSAPASPSSLAEKIVYLADRPDEVARLGAAGRLRVLSHFTLDRCAGAHEALIRSLRRNALS